MNGEEKRGMAVENTALAETVDVASAVGRERVDAQIAEIIAARDHRAALRLCACHHSAAIGRLCMALVGSQAEAEDLVQETLLDAHDAFDTWRGEGTLRAWLFAIARRKCARYLERRVRHSSRLRLVHDAERQPEADHVLLERERAEAARAALATLRPSEREALVLHFVGEQSFRDVAQACGIAEAAARKRVSRALCKLREAVVRSRK